MSAEDEMMDEKNREAGLTAAARHIDNPAMDIAGGRPPAPLQDTIALVGALQAALEKIRAASVDPDPVEMVHDARKAMKEYRALLRLVPGPDARIARHETASAARGLAHARDRDTALDALDMLKTAGVAEDADIDAARAAIGMQVPAEEQNDALRGLISLFLSEAQTRLALGLGAQAARADLVKGLRKGYRAARQADFSSAPAMHEIRKRVVTHRYQMSFLAEWFSGKGAKRAARMQRLRDVFGAYQDIETLRPLLHAASDQLDEGNHLRLEQAMTRLQKRLEKQAHRAHARLFWRKPRDFARRLRPLGEAVAPARTRTADTWHVMDAPLMDDDPQD